MKYKSNSDTEAYQANSQGGPKASPQTRTKKVSGPAKGRTNRETDAP